MASSSPAADGCQPRYSSSTGAPATKAHQTKEPPRLLGISSVSLLTFPSTGDCFLPDHELSTNGADQVFASLELLECERDRTSLLAFVAGDADLFLTARNLVEQSKFAERLCV